jgi:2-amino-4-hydroxy-6-hydroxymethyldihydropteridine diphosphokinase
MTLPVLISLGSNIRPKDNLREASRLLSEKVKEIKFSSIWESLAVGSRGPNYLNSAALIDTDLSLEAIKTTIISPIENQLGRLRTADKYSDRTIDLDVLIYNDHVIDPELWTQAHLAVPASELLPDFENPNTGASLLETAAELGGRTEIFQRIDLD